MWSSNAKDIGTLKKLKKLNIRTPIYGLHLLKNLESLKISKQEIKKK